MPFRRILFSLCLLLASFSLRAQSEPRIDSVIWITTDDPRDTMRTFLEAMVDYKKGIETDDPILKNRIKDAVRTLDLSEITVLKDQTGEEAAICLKEVIDRTIVIDYNLIPSLDRDDPNVEFWKADLERRAHRWRLKDTEITIRRVDQGSRQGEYLFTSDTVMRAKDWYERIKGKPYLEALPPERRGTGFEKPLVEQILPEWMNGLIFEIAIWQWVMLALSLIVGFFIKGLIQYLVILSGRIVSKSKSHWDDRLVAAFKGPLGYIVTAGVWFLMLHILHFKGSALSVLTLLLKLFTSIMLIWLVYRLSEVGTDYLAGLTRKTESTLDDQLVPLLNRAVKMIVVIAGILLTVQNLGFNVFSLLAGLGIGGLALALAAKDTVANFFGSLMILFDRPFQVGDWILVGGVEGTVEEIGFRSTRIRTFYDSVISVPNSEVANAKIDNMGLRQYRRIKTVLGVTYDTPAEKVEAFLEGIKNIIKNNPMTRKDYFHVVFNDYGPSSLNILLYFFLKVPSWADELVERQNVLLEILRLANTLEVEFAFPTQTLHVFDEEPKEEHKINLKNLAKGANAFGANGEKARPKGSGLFIPPHRESGSATPSAGGE